MDGTADGGMKLTRKRSAVDWSDLLPDVLRLIAGCLTNIWEYVRFRSVCSSWRSAADRPPQTPSLLLPYDFDGTARSFLDPSSRRITTIDIPEARGKCIYGTPFGWLVIIGEQEADAEGRMLEVLLFNLVTRTQIFLPQLKLKITAGADLPEQQIFPYIRSVLTGNPAVAAGQTFFLSLLVYDQLAICRIGGEAWTTIKLRVPTRSRNTDCAYFDGAFYIVDGSEGITVVSITSMEMQYSITLSNDSIVGRTSLHLVESLGDLLLIERTGWGYDFKVFKLDRSNNELKWVSMKKNVGDRTLFVGTCSSMSLFVSDLMVGGKDLICFADRDIDSDNTIVSVSDIVGGRSIMRQENYWQGSTGVWENKDILSVGLIWIKPTLC